ncbi:hypothetical protein [Buchananella felis]|uniref:hypothetical protein n=1 Tax=Buchananella felis TaxID=3231492 RepID=UPI0035285053
MEVVIRPWRGGDAARLLELYRATPDLARQLPGYRTKCVALGLGFRCVCWAKWGLKLGWVNFKVGQNVLLSGLVFVVFATD